MDSELCRVAPPDWSVKALADVCRRVTSGGTPSRSNSAFFQDGQWGWVKTQELRDGWIDDTEEHITDEAVASSSAKVLPENTLLLAMYGATVGQLGLLRRPMTCNQACCALVVDESRADVRYLFYQLLNSRRELRSLATGAAQQNLSGAVIKSLRFPFPPLREQRAIGGILGALDDKIELNRRMSETLEAMARALFQSWFVDFDPVRASLENRDSGLPAHLARIFPRRVAESKLGDIPEGWTVSTAGEVFEVGIGRTPPRKESQWFSLDASDVPWISIRDLGAASTFISSVNEYLTAAAVEQFRIRRIPDHTVVLSFKLTVGRVAITDGEMTSNEAIAHFLPRQSVVLSPAFLYCYLRTFDFNSLGSTSSIATAVNSDSVRSIKVLIPSAAVHDAFSAATAPMFLRLRLLQRESRTLAALRDTLLPKLISGELRVKDAERLVGNAV